MTCMRQATAERGRTRAEVGAHPASRLQEKTAVSAVLRLRPCPGGTDMHVSTSGAHAEHCSRCMLKSTNT